MIRLRRTIGYAIQEVGLFPHFTVARNIGVVPHIEAWPADRIQSRVQELMKLVGLEPNSPIAIPANFPEDSVRALALRAPWLPTRLFS